MVLRTHIWFALEITREHGHGHGRMKGGVGKQSADLMFLFLREVRDALIHREWALTFQIEDLKLFIFAKTL